MIRELERVILAIDLPERGLERGDVGTVVHVYGDGLAYEVEFMTLDGETIDVVTLEASDVRQARADEIAHARTLARV